MLLMSKSHSMENNVQFTQKEMKNGCHRFKR